jgi:hypothetical protein
VRSGSARASIEVLLAHRRELVCAGADTDRIGESREWYGLSLEGYVVADIRSRFPEASDGSIVAASERRPIVLVRDAADLDFDPQRQP